MYPGEYLYSEKHEWIKVEGDMCLLGITAFAQEELGEVVHVELPELGETYEQDAEIGTIESVKAVAEVYTPVGGEVVEVNEALDDEPETVNEDPHGRGWLARLKMTDPGQVEGLMNAEKYEAFVQGDG